MNNEILQTIQELLLTPKSIVITCHKNPDGDAIGSSIALDLFLKKEGHDSKVIIPNEFPDFLNWLPASQDCLVYDKNVEKAATLFEKADVIFTLDFNNFSRTGTMETELTKAKEIGTPFVMIDHHQAPDDYATATYSDIEMCSTCEMVYHFIDAMKGHNKISAAIATLLYTGIMTDTGSFKYSSTTATTHRVIANLIDKGANGTRIHQEIYDTNSPNRMQLLGVALRNLTILPEYHTAYITLSQRELEEHHFKKGDTEGFVNYALSVKGIVLAVIFIENKKDNIIKMSLRSKGAFSVNEMAREHYQGGGHNNAAGGKSDLPMQETITNFISILPNYKQQLTYGS